jgi:hypothetical protein
MSKSKFNIEMEIIPLNYNIEKYICLKLDLSPYKSYAPMSEKEIIYIYQKVLNKFTATSIPIPEYFCQKIILSIRANLMRNNMIVNHKKVLSQKYDIISDYGNGMGILKLSTKYDGSPLNLLRLIFDELYGKKLTQLIKKNKILSQRDKKELELAVSNDLYALINQNEVLKKSTDFELKIQKILDANNIKYKTQEQLAQEQIKNSNIATNTPDFLILDDLFINSKKINWIDAKNFYGLNTHYIRKRIKHQTKKYLDAWGSGAIIFNLGFSSKLALNDILFVDFYSFEKNFSSKLQKNIHE